MFFASRRQLVQKGPSLARVVKPRFVCGFATKNHHFWFELERSSTAAYCMNIGGPALLVGFSCACLEIDCGVRSMIGLCLRSKLDADCFALCLDLWLVVVGLVHPRTPLSRHGGVQRKLLCSEYPTGRPMSRDLGRCSSQAQEPHCVLELWALQHRCLDCGFGCVLVQSLLDRGTCACLGRLFARSLGCLSPSSLQLAAAMAWCFN